MASGAGIQSYYEFGVGIPFKKITVEIYKK